MIPINHHQAVRLAAVFACALVTVAVAGGPPHETAGRALHQVPLSGSAWHVAPSMRRITTSSQETAFQYVGTGTPVDATTYLRIAVSPGTTYVFSAMVNPSSLMRPKVRGRSGFDLFIDPLSGKFSYASTLLYPSGVAARYATPEWRCPPGVTEVLLGMQLVHASVVKGARLTFSDPVLSDAPSATTSGRTATH